MLTLLALFACQSGDDTDPTGDTCGTVEAPPAPDAWGPRTGPGGPSATIASDRLYAPCAFLTGGPEDVDHHNHAVMVDGYLLLPWAPEDGGGGLTFFDLSDPCAPVKVGEAFSPLMRESHTIGLSTHDGRRYAAVDYLADDGTGAGGVGLWDITDPTDPVWVAEAAIPNHHYPDSYTRLTLSVTWQGRYAYAATAQLGTVPIDLSDPLAPVVLDPIRFGGVHVVGTWHAWGNRALVSSAGLARTVYADTSDPLVPEVLPGGDFNTTDADGEMRPYYFANVGSQYALFARSAEGGGPLVYDLSSDTPTFLDHVHNPGGDGGYIFQHEDKLFIGDSQMGGVYDFAPPAALTHRGTFFLPGDLDTVTPIGNVAIVSVDEDADPGKSSAVTPWATDPDRRPPTPGMTSPRDGEVYVAATSRIGVAFDEMIEPVSAFPGSFRVTDPCGRLVPGRFNVQENLVNFTPDDDLPADTTYTVTLPAGGLIDLSGNALASDLTFRFSTGSAL